MYLSIILGALNLHWALLRFVLSGRPYILGVANKLEISGLFMDISYSNAIS